MSAAGLLLELRAYGIDIDIDIVENKIRCRHAPGGFPPELAEQVRERRGVILALLADPDALRVAVAGELFDTEEEVMQCRGCGTRRDAGVAICPVCHPRPDPESRQ